MAASVRSDWSTASGREEAASHGEKAKNKVSARTTVCESDVHLDAGRPGAVASKFRSILPCAAYPPDETRLCDHDANDLRFATGGMKTTVPETLRPRLRILPHDPLNAVRETSKRGHQTRPR